MFCCQAIIVSKTVAKNKRTVAAAIQALASKARSPIHPAKSFKRRLKLIGEVRILLLVLSCVAGVLVITIVAGGNRK